MLDIYIMIPLSKDILCSCNLLLILALSYMVMLGSIMVNNSHNKYLLKQLDFRQNQKYKKIKKERLYHYNIGLISSSLLGLLIYSMLSNKKNKLCLAGLVVFLFTPIIYYCLPKSDYMIKHLNTEQQKMAWLNVSRSYNKKKMLSYVGGIIIYYFLVIKFF